MVAWEAKEVSLQLPSFLPAEGTWRVPGQNLVPP